MHMRSCIKNECVFDSSKMEDIDFLIYSGKINLYILEKPGMRIVFNDKESSSSESQEKDEKKDKKDEKKPKKEKKDEKKEKNEDENDPKNMTLIREMKAQDCFGSFEVNIMKQNNTRFNKILAYTTEPSKIIIFEKKSKSPNENKIMSRRDLYQTQREIKNKDKNNPNYYDPEIFLFDDPQKIISVIDKVKEQVNENFNNEDLEYSKSLMTELKREKEFLDVCDHLGTSSDLKETLNYIENKYENYYNEQSIVELKLGTIVQKTINFPINQ